MFGSVAAEKQPLRLRGPVPGAPNRNMSQPGNDIHELLRRFPEHWAEIRSLWGCDFEFGALSGEYIAARRALTVWRGRAGSKAEARVGEYRQIVSELEMEIGDLLDACAREGRRARRPTPGT